MGVVDRGARLDASTVCAQASDAECLDAYRKTRSEAAFNTIVDRHGAMVFRTCHRLLNDVQESEDAAQAVFLILAQHSSSARHPLSLWLYDRARDSARVVLKSRARRRRREAMAADARSSAMSESDAANHLRETLDAALSRLPAHQREALILRYLEGHGVESSAQMARCAPRTFARYCEEGLQRLRGLLAGGGAAVGGATLVAMLASEASAKISTSTLIAMKATLAGAAAETAIASVTAQGVMKAMFWAQAKTVAACGLAAAVAVTSIPLAVRAWAPAKPAPVVRPAIVPPAVPVAVPVAPSPERAFVSLHQLISPAQSETAWERLPWMLNLWDARRAAVREQKPILFFNSWGHPLTAASIEGLQARGRILSDAGVRKTLDERFILCVGDDWYESRRTDAEGVFFKGFAIKKQLVTSRIYCITPGGTLLASCDLAADVNEARTQIGAALDAYGKLPASARTAEIAAFRPDARLVRVPPRNALVIRCASRSLELDAEKKFARGSNGIDPVFRPAVRDNLWLTESEWRALIVKRVKVGDTLALPPSILKRICRYHLVDNTRGEGLRWDDSGIQSASLMLTAESVVGTRVKWRAQGSAVLTSVKPRAGYEPKLEGYIEYDIASERIERFDLTAIGERWGQGEYDANARPGRTPLGVAFELATPAQVLPSDAVPPHGIRDENEYFGSAVQ